MTKNPHRRSTGGPVSAGVEAQCRLHILPLHIRQTPTKHVCKVRTLVPPSLCDDDPSITLKIDLQSHTKGIVCFSATNQAISSLSDFSALCASLDYSKPDYQLYPSSVYDAYRKVMSLAREYVQQHAFFPHAQTHSDVSHPLRS